MKNSKNVLSNQEGFTMLEAVLSMLILSVVMVLLPLTFQAFAAIDRTVTVEEDFEWNLFLIHLRGEMNESDDVKIFNDRIYIVINNHSIGYEKYGLVVRRRVNDKGHEVVLQNIEDFELIHHGHWFMMKVDFMDGTKEEAQFLIKK